MARESKRVTAVEISLTDKIEKETTLREVAHNKLQQSLQDAIVGNYAYLVFGAFWVVVGIIISALAPEIAKTMAGQWELVRKGL